MLRPAPSVASVKPYHPPLSGRSGLRLDFNENTAGCSPRVVERLRSLNAEDLTRYPEREPVERVVAGWLGLSAAEIVLTNGVDEAIHLLCETYVQPGDEAIVVVPTFGMYEVYASAAGAKVATVPAGEDYRFPTAAVLKQISEKTRLVAIANPNNPTGAVASADDLLRVVARASAAAVLVDEAYFEFYGQSLIGEVGGGKNLFIARTFSKAYGMAGLRAGVLAGPAEQIAFVRRIASPYNVNGVALACLPAALADGEYVSAYAKAVRRGRARLQDELAALGIKCWPSQANFVLAQLGAARPRFIAAMRQRGILVRDRNNDPGCAGCVRITVGTEAHMEALIAALREYAREGSRAAEVPA
jgi:histidinol-phosphate aminotransferase